MANKNSSVFICIINNFNYARYLNECLNSVLEQSRPFDRVIVVDDGSSDESRSVIESYTQAYPKIVSVFQENQGQLSTFNAAVPYVTESSQVFLLDADDIYPKDYLELISNLFNNKFPNFTFCEPKYSDSDSILQINSARKSNQDNQHFLKTSAIVRNRRCWIGSPTSCLTISGTLFHKIFPYPYANDFRIRADDAIIMAASVLGADKTYIPSLQIGYRVHQKNNFYSKLPNRDASVQHDKAILRCIDYYCKKFKISPYPTLREFYKELNALSKTQIERLELPGSYRILNRLIRGRIKSFCSLLR